MNWEVDMRILVVNKHVEDEIGGSEIQCDIISKYLLKYGHLVTYIAVKSEHSCYRSPYDVIPLFKLTVKSFRNILEQVDPDLVYWRYNKKSLLTIAWLCRDYRCKFVFSITALDDIKKWSYYPQSFFAKLKQLITGRINYIGYRFVDGIVSLRKDFLPMLPNYTSVKKTIIYDCMEVGSIAEFRRDKPYVVWVASIKKIKNPEFYVRAAQRLIDLPIDFLMIGKITDESYRYLTNKDVLPPNLFYLGEMPPEAVNDILRGSLFLVHTCRPEGFGNNFIQAWLQGKPTVSLFFDPDGLIEGYRIGYCSRSLDRMCEQIRRLVEDNELRRDMGLRAKRMAREYFDPETNVKRFESFFEDLLSSR
jgi:glycosyltransferase involved in cell wall biosynthesis